jgi:hypothetical protein
MGFFKFLYSLGQGRKRERVAGVFLGFHFFKKFICL